MRWRRRTCLLAVFALLTACSGGGAVARESSAGHSAAAASPRPTNPATGGFNCGRGQAASVDSGSKDPHGRWSKGVRDVFRPGRGLGTSHFRPLSDLRDKRTELPRLRWLHPEPDGSQYSGRLGQRRPASGGDRHRQQGNSTHARRIRRRARDPRRAQSARQQEARRHRAIPERTRTTRGSISTGRLAGGRSSRRPSANSTPRKCYAFRGTPDSTPRSRSSIQIAMSVAAMLRCAAVSSALSFGRGRPGPRCGARHCSRSRCPRARRRDR